MMWTENQCWVWWGLREELRRFLNLFGYHLVKLFLGLELRSNGDFLGGYEQDIIIMKPFTSSIFFYFCMKLFRVEIKSHVAQAAVRLTTYLRWPQTVVPLTSTSHGLGLQVSATILSIQHLAIVMSHYRNELKDTGNRKESNPYY